MKAIAFLEPNVYVRVIEDNVLLYNTENNTSIVYRNNNIIAEFVTNLIKDDQLYITCINDFSQCNQELKEFLKELQEKHMGGFYYKKALKVKPVQLVLNYSDELPKTTKDEFSPMEHLKTINLYVNNEYGDNNFNMIKQVHWVYKDREYLEISYKTLYDLLMQFVKKNITINIIGGNIFNYSEISRLIDILEKLRINTCFYLHYSLINKDDLNKLSNFKIKILIDNLVNKELIIQKLLGLNILLNFELLFLIESNSDLKVTLEIAGILGIDNYRLIPFLNGKNYNFFKKNIFMRIPRILNSGLTNRDIFSKKIVNPLCYGELNILPNCDVYANFNHCKIGNLRNNNFVEILLKEIIKGNSWKKHRGKVKPCNKCLYRDLCPPISNYEYVLKKFDLCLKETK